MDVQARDITYLSPSASVNMGDWWFDIATIDHFWIRRRFEVMKRLADSLIRRSREIAEIGCGNGLLQKNIEDHYQRSVVGFDLNEIALRKNVSSISPLYCYDIFEKRPEFSARFDLLILFDVLEHIDDESWFLQCVKYHLAESGTLLVNVPAIQWLFSDYDRAAGHVRRYSLNQLVRVARQNGYEIQNVTYWGLPLFPLLLVRKALNLEISNGSAGFDPGDSLMNHLLAGLSRFERIPQRFLGTSVMAGLKVRPSKQ
jgi:SAM-dependent methyltransferase